MDQEKLTTEIARRIIYSEREVDILVLLCSRLVLEAIKQESHWNQILGSWLISLWMKKKTRFFTVRIVLL